MKSCLSENTFDEAIFRHLVGEALDAAFAQDGDSEEEDAVVSQVLDEIGIDLRQQV